MGLSQEVHDAGQEIASATEGTVQGTLNRVLGRFLGWPFEATPGYASDRDGNRTARFASVVHTASDADAIPANAGRVFCPTRHVIDELFDAYRRTSILRGHAAGRLCIRSGRTSRSGHAVPGGGRSGRSGRGGVPVTRESGSAEKGLCPVYAPYPQPLRAEPGRAHFRPRRFGLWRRTMRRSSR